MLYTQSQQAARDRLVQMGRLFYSHEPMFPEIDLRLKPLLIGPTGVGKSLIVKTAAHRLDAHYFRVTRGDWNVVGSRSGRSTSFQVLDRVATYKRVLLHIDELDKFSNLQAGDWSASIASGLWDILESSFQIGEYLSETKFAEGEALTEQELQARIQNLWIVGSGTWNDVFVDEGPRRHVEFVPCAEPAAVGMESIERAGLISQELLFRFNSDPIILSYPTIEETRGLLRSSGVSAMADRLRVKIAAEDINWSRGGMRALETVATRLALLFDERRCECSEENEASDQFEQDLPIHCAEL